MILGRRRRYFGYPHDVESFVDTPQSAKSYASYISNASSITKCRVKNQFVLKPDPPVSNRYADKYLHSAIATQIPALLPPMKNTFHFKEYEDNPMKFHAPQLEHHFERSLYYIWLSKNDRKELCHIVDAHLGKRSKDQSRMPRTLSLLDEVSPKSKALKSKFQRGPWDPPKTPRDRFVRDHGKSPAMEAICNAYPGNARTRVTEADIQDCLLAAKRLLGPYAGLNTNFGSGSQEDIPDELLEIMEERDRLENQKQAQKKEDGFAKRPFGYNSTQIKYERQINAAMNYYNRIKLGTRHPTPPPEIFRKLIRYHGKLVGKKTRASMRRSAAYEEGNVITGKRKFNKSNVTEEDYMDMYLHFLGPDEDISVKESVRSLTDITKVRKKMHLDENSDDDEQNAAISQLVREDSFSDIKNAHIRKLLREELYPSRTVSELMEKTSEKISEEKLPENNNRGPEIKEIFKKTKTRQIYKRSSKKLSVSSTPAMSRFNMHEDEDETEDDMLEKEFGYITKDPEELLMNVRMPIREESIEELSNPSSSDTDVSSQKADINEDFGIGCNMNDLECLSNEGAFGPQPFGAHKSEANLQNDQYSKYYVDTANEKNIFDPQHWKDKRQSMIEMSTDRKKFSLPKK